MAVVDSITEPTRALSRTQRSRVADSLLSLAIGRHIAAPDAVALVVCVLVPSLWTLITTFTLPARAVGFYALLTISVFAWGRVLFSLTGLSAYVPRLFSHGYLVGSLWLAFWLAAIRLLTPLELPALFALQLALALVLYFAQRGRIARWNARVSSQWVSCLVVVLSLLASTFWLRHLCPVWQTTADVAAFKPFVEYFFHRTHVTPLLLPGWPLTNGSIQFAGAPIAFYHYASYVYPALLTSVGGVPGYEAMIALWYPLGTFLAGLAAFWLGQLLFGTRAGFWSFVAVRLLPDAALWSFRTNFFSYNVFYEGSPALAYAVATAAVSLAVMIVALRQRKPAYVALAFAIAFASVFFKANVFMAITPLCGLLFLGGYRRFGHRIMLPSLALLAVVALSGLWLATRLRSAPTVGIDPNFGQAYLDYVFAREIAPDAALQRLQPLLRPGPAAAQIVARMIIVALVTFQFGIALLAAAIAVSLFQFHRLRWSLGLLACVLAIYLTSAVLLPPNANGDPYELQHRNFAWAYLIAVVWSAGVFATTWNANVARRWRTGYLAAVPLLGVPLVLGANTYIETPRPAPRGLTDCALFVRDHSRPLDVVWDSHSDPTLLVAALSGLRSYVCINLDDPFPGSGALRQLHATRAAESQRIKQSTTLAELAEFARTTGARWYLLRAGESVSWPASWRDRPAFASQGFRVYDLNQLETTNNPEAPR